jgi:membrane protein DedA with SNARE-associated domain
MENGKLHTFNDCIHTKEHVWPFSNHPELLARGLKFFARWGVIAVFSGRFFGPFRAIVPILAGLYATPWLHFQIANVTSAAVWAASIFMPGFLSSAG